jgi:PEP-CTERM motif
LPDGDSVITVDPGKTFGLTIGNSITVQAIGRIGVNRGTIINNGTITTFDGALFIYGSVTNNGIMTSNAGDALDLPTNGFTNNGSISVDGIFTADAPNEAMNNGRVTVSRGGTADFTSGYVQNGGAVTTVNGTMNITRNGNAVMGVLNGGMVNGAGVINGGAVNMGIVAPGNPRRNVPDGGLSSGYLNYNPGLLTMNGDYQQPAEGALAIQIDGSDFGIGQYSRLTVTGHSSISGDLDVSLGFTPRQSDEFTILTSAGGINGYFLDAVPDHNGIGHLSFDGGEFDVIYNSTSIVLDDYQTPEPGTLLLVGTSALAIGGFLRKRSR